MWNARLELISADYLVSLNLSEEECQQVNQLRQRIMKIWKIAEDPMIPRILSLFGNLPKPLLSKTQEAILKNLERLHDLT